MRHHLVVWVAAVVALGIGVTPVPCVAYVRSVGPGGQPVRWRSASVTLSLSRNELPSGVTEDAALTALKHAAAAWSTEAPCADVRLSAGEPTDAWNVERPGTNIVAFRRTSWCKDGLRRDGACYSQAEAARTALRTEADQGEELIVGADVELNAVDFRFRVPGVSAPSKEGDTRPVIDLEQVLTHELGHVLGFEHPCRSVGSSRRAREDDRGRPLGPCMPGDPAPATVMLSSWRPSESASSLLGLEDKRALCAVYPRTTEPQAAGRHFGCRTAPGDRGMGAPWLLVLSLALGRGSARRRASSTLRYRTLGSWRREIE